MLVEPDLSVPGHPEIFVVGDAAAYFDRDKKPLPGVAQVAMQQANTRRERFSIACGEALAAVRLSRQGQHGDRGRGAAVADLGWIQFSGVTAWLSWLFLHIVQLIGFRNRLLVLCSGPWRSSPFSAA